MLNSFLSMGNSFLFGIMDTVFSLASSKYAILIYIMILFVIISVLVIILLINDSKGGKAKAANVIFDKPIYTPTPAAQPKAEKSVPERTESVKEDRNEDSEAEEERAPRFCMLSRIDENKKNYEARRFEEEASLKRFCDNFRNYAAAVEAESRP